MMNESDKRICIVGIGNPFRGDDGAGAMVCKLLKQKKMLHCDYLLMHQPDLAMAAELAGYENVIFVDASLNEKLVKLAPLQINRITANSFSHEISLPMLAAVCRQLYSASTEFYTCAIGAFSFEPGQGLSSQTERNVHAAVSLIQSSFAQANMQ
jgi:hydrogenase maturation protease